MVTQRDIADRVGLSVSLVSRALSGTAAQIGVPEATIQRVRDVATELGYMPNLTARILRGASAQTFGVVVYDFVDPFFGPLVGELQRLAHERQFSLVLGGFEKRRVWDLDVQALLKHQIDGLIIIGSGDIDWAAPFIEKGLPIVRIGSGPLNEGVHSVVVDDESGMEALIDLLHKQGTERIGFVGAAHASHRHRANLADAALRRRGLRAGLIQSVFSEAHLADAGYEACLRLLEGSDGCDLQAIMAGSDMVALGVLRVLMEKGARVPGDVRVTGYDDLPVARLSIPSLTTVRQPIADMAQSAFDAVMNKQAPAQRVFKPELIVRESAR